MAFENLNEFVYEVDAPEDEFATLNPTFDAVRLLMHVWDWSGTPTLPAIENPATVVDFGEHIPISGIAIDNTVGFTSHAEGIVAAATDTVLAVARALTHLLHGMCGTAPTFSTGSVTAGVPTVSAMDENVGGAHAVNQLAAFVLPSGVIEVRPIVAYASPGITLGIKLSAAPAAGALIYGSASVEFDDNPCPMTTIQSRRVHGDEKLNLELLGQALSLSMSEVGTNEVQTIAWSSRLVAFSKNYADTREDPPAYQASVFAGSTILLGAALNDAVPAATDFMCLTFGGFSLNMNLTYLPIGGKCGEPKGADDWFRQKGGRPEVTVVVPHSKKPSEAAAADGSGGLGLSATDWEDVWNNKDAENDFQILGQFGDQAGRMFTFYGRHMALMMEPEEVDLGDGLAGYTLTFRALTGGAEPRYIFSQS